MSRIFLASFGFSWLLMMASADDVCSGESGCSNRKGIGAALIQTKLHGSMQAFADEVDRNSKAEKTTLGNALQLVTRLVDKSGGHSWNMTDDEKLAVDTIRDMIGDLFNGSKIQHGEDQFEVDQAQKRIQDCTDNLRDTKGGQVTSAHETANVSRNTHIECRVRENKIIANTSAECREYHDFRTNSDNFNPFPACLSSDLTFDHISTHETTKKENMEKCLVDTVEKLTPLYHHYLGCKESFDLWEEVDEDCDNKQRSFENAYCAYSTHLTTACRTYSTCRDQAKADRNNTHDMVKKAEEARKADWETAEHIMCLLGVFESENSNKARDLKACTDAVIDTSIIDIVYRDVPEADECPGDWRDDKPCDEAWKVTEYSSQSWYNSTAMADCVACEE